MKDLHTAGEHFLNVLKQQFLRVEKMKEQKDFVDYKKLKTIKIGIIKGDGIGPNIVSCAEKVLNAILQEEIEKNIVTIKEIEGLTIENRARLKQSVPDYVLEKIKDCDVILKGPTTTPRKGDNWPQLESANVVLRRELDLFANVRPIKIEEEGIDWVFFRENTEGAYTLGSKGLNLGEIFVDFTVSSVLGTKRIAELAFSYARKTKRKKVSIITKANIIKTTDGSFLEICRDVQKNYPEIEVDDWYVDIAAAKLVDRNSRKDFSVFLLPNLYGDILTDEAAQLQGGVGTAGSANIGKRYAMFEAIHGSAPRMVEEGLSCYANPTSILRAVSLMLFHIGFFEKAEKLEKALDFCTKKDSKVKVTGFKDGATTEEFYSFLMENF